MTKYRKVKDGDLVKIDHKAKWMCCDCGLVHVVVFEIPGNHNLRMYRDRRATASRRRRKVVK